MSAAWDKAVEGAEGGENVDTEDIMIKKLLASGKYDILPNISTPLKGVQGTKPKTFSVGRGRAKLSDTFSLSQPNPDDQTVSFNLRGHSQIVSSEVIPKIPPFSGDEPPQKGDVTYSEWRFEIKCLQGDPGVSSGHLLQAMRRSLRGTARKMLIPLGERATTSEILDKLDALFSDISTNGMIMQEFFNSFQLPNENVTSFGCRIESLLQTAIDNNHLRKEAKNDLLRHKFWTSLSSEKLKSQTRHKYDTIQNYDQLLREIRQVEKEINISSRGTCKSGESNVLRERKVHSHTISADTDETEKRLFALERKLDAKVSEIETRMDDKFSKILERLELNAEGNSSFRGNYGTGRGNGRQFGNNRGQQRHTGNRNTKQNESKD